MNKAKHRVREAYHAALLAGVTQRQVAADTGIPEAALSQFKASGVFGQSRVDRLGGWLESNGYLSETHESIVENGIEEEGGGIHAVAVQPAPPPAPDVKRAP